jgi:hypothetical protein
MTAEGPVRFIETARLSLFSSYCVAIDVIQTPQINAVRTKQGALRMLPGDTDVA